MPLRVAPGWGPVCTCPCWWLHQGAGFSDTEEVGHAFVLNKHGLMTYQNVFLLPVPGWSVARRAGPGCVLPDRRAGPADWLAWLAKSQSCLFPFLAKHHQKDSLLDRKHIRVWGSISKSLFCKQEFK